MRRQLPPMNQHIGLPSQLEYSDEEIEILVSCKGDHSFYVAGKMYGALKYCDECKLGYKV